MGGYNLDHGLQLKSELSHRPYIAMTRNNLCIISISLLFAVKEESWIPKKLIKLSPQKCILIKVNDIFDTGLF